MNQSCTERHSVSIPFKGKRDYVQGPDLVNSALEHFGGDEIVHAKFSIHGFVRHPNCTVCISSSAPEDSSAPLRGEVVTRNGKFRVEISENPADGTPARRIGYDESRVTDHCVIDGEAITLETASPFSPLETFVSMNKHLMQALAPPGGGKWIFTAVELNKIISKVEGGTTIRMLHNFQNKLVKSGIFLDNEPAGVLYFSLIES